MADPGEALRRLADALADRQADVSEDEILAALRRMVGSPDRRQLRARDMPRTPLPLPGGSSSVTSDVEWV
jgi:hypothetical protein